MGFEYNSVFAEEMNKYIEIRNANNITGDGYKRNLVKFDTFLIDNNVIEKVFTKELADEWVIQRLDEVNVTHYRRVNDTKHFVSYLYAQGYDVHLFRDVRYIASDFIPHIYTDDEIDAYFTVVDNYYQYFQKESKTPFKKVMIPVLFRILYCCGTRITETLSVRKKDVDLENGVIRLVETKGSKERYVVMSDSLRELMVSFADKTFYMIGDEDYIFHHGNKEKYSADTINDMHLNILRIAGIPRKGKEIGPRVHDWRHTFAVRAFKQMSDQGMDLYVSLPILSAYLGHETIYATEKYLRLTLSLYPELEEKLKPQYDEIFKELPYAERD